MMCCETASFAIAVRETCTLRCFRISHDVLLSPPWAYIAWWVEDPMNCVVHPDIGVNDQTRQELLWLLSLIMRTPDRRQEWTISHLKLVGQMDSLPWIIRCCIFFFCGPRTSSPIHAHEQRYTRRHTHSETGMGVRKVF